jgi:K+-sensing histidine kinase KdpD
MPQQRDVLGRLLVLAATILCVALSTLLADVFTIMGAPAPYLAFMPSIALCCLFDGLSAGALSTSLSTLSLWYFLIPPDGFALPERGDVGHLFIFLSVAAFLCWIIDSQRRSNDQLAQENFELGYKVSLMRTIRSFGGSRQR